MSFGLLKHFKDNKSKTSQAITDRHFQHVIIGQDLGAVLKLLNLLRHSPGESVRLITSKEISRQTLIEHYQYGISKLRSSLAVEHIYKKYHNAKISPQAQEAVFYKDGKFHDFGSRAKPMELQFGEEFFTQKGYHIELDSFFQPDDWEKLDEIIKTHSEIRIFDAIEKSSSQDLIDKKEWKLSFKDFSILSAEHLYISGAPQKFLSLIPKKELLSSEFIDVCTKANVQAGMSLTWVLDKEIFSEDRTLFIPQSMTHEWGHFILEFEPFDYHHNHQLCHVMFLIHETEPQAEELASKIKLLKRVTERVFPDLSKHITKEHIWFEDELLISEVKDTSLEQVLFDYPTLHFLGQMSPMPQDLVTEKFLSRVLLN